MSQIVKDGENGFGIQVPVCAGICSSPSTSTEIPLNGQLVVGTTTRPATNGNKPLFIGDGGNQLQSLDPINKVFPLKGKNVRIKAPQNSGETPETDDTIVGGFTVNADNLDGGEGSVSKKIKNFTAESVKVILESGSYGDYEKMSGIVPTDGQLFFLIGDET